MPQANTLSFALRAIRPLLLRNVNSEMHYVLVRHYLGSYCGEVECTNGVVAPPRFGYLNCGGRYVAGTGRGLAGFTYPALGAVLISAVKDDDRADGSSAFVRSFDAMKLGTFDAVLVCAL